MCVYLNIWTDIVASIRLSNVVNTIHFILFLSFLMISSRRKASSLPEWNTNSSQSYPLLEANYTRTF